MSALAEYRRKHSISQAIFAALIGVDQGYVSRIERGDCTPGLQLAIDIAHVTKGAVPVTCWSKPTPGLDAP